jgi:hypothetical protein
VTLSPSSGTHCTDVYSLSNQTHDGRQAGRPRVGDDGEWTVASCSGRSRGLASCSGRSRGEGAADAAEAAQDAAEAGGTGAAARPADLLTQSAVTAAGVAAAPAHTANASVSGTAVGMDPKGKGRRESPAAGQAATGADQVQEHGQHKGARRSLDLAAGTADLFYEGSMGKASSSGERGPQTGKNGASAGTAASAAVLPPQYNRKRSSVATSAGEKVVKMPRNADDLMDVIDGGLSKGPHWPRGGELLWDWAPTIVKASKLPLVAERKRQGLDAGLGLFAVKKIEPMQLVAILIDGPVYEDRQDPAIKDKEVVLVRQKAFKFEALYQGGALDDLEAEAKTNYPGWMANSPAEGSECNCVCMSQCAGENRLWFSFLISVKAIKANQEILSNALPYDKEWEKF